MWRLIGITLRCPTRCSLGSGDLGMNHSLKGYWSCGCFVCGALDQVQASGLETRCLSDCQLPGDASRGLCLHTVTHHIFTRKVSDMESMREELPIPETRKSGTFLMRIVTGVFCVEVVPWWYSLCGLKLYFELHRLIMIR